MQKKLLVLCSHEPTLDPRIDWSAHFGVSAGYDVVVAGWTQNNPPPKFPDSGRFRTIRSNVESENIGAKAVKSMIKKHKVFSAVHTPGTSCLVLLLLLLFSLYRLILAPWVILDFVLEKLRISKYTTRQVEHVVEIVRKRLFYFIDDLIGGKLSYLMESYEGYKWYLRTHSFGAAGALLKQLEDLDWSPDIIHANDPDAMLGAVLLKKKYGARIVYDAHEYGPDAYLLRPKPRSIFFWFEKQMLRHFDAAVTVTPQLARKFQARYKGKPYFHVVPNASPLPGKLKRYSDATIAKHGKGKVKFLYHGGFAPHRGIEEIISGFKDIDPAKAALFIRGPENDYKPILVKHAKDEGALGKNVFFLDSIAEQDLIASARLVDVGIIPYLSHIENHAGACPNKLSQYMHAKVAVLAVNLEFVADVVTSAGAGLLYNDRVDNDFTKKVNAFIESPKERKSYAKQGQEYGKSTYNYETYFQVMKALFDDEAVPSNIPHTI